MRHIILIALTLILFSSFRNDNRKSLRSVCWNLVGMQVDSGTPIRYVTKSKPFLVIKDSTFYGNSGCNDFTGKCSVKNDSITFDRPSATKMWCSEINWIEDGLFHKLMHGKAKYVISGDSLYLYTKNSAVFRFYKKGDKSKCFCKFSEE